MDFWGYILKNGLHFQLHEVDPLDPMEPNNPVDSGDLKPFGP